MYRFFFYFVIILLNLSCGGRSENVAGQFTIDVPIDIGAGLPPTKTHYFLHRDVEIKFDEYLKTLGLSSKEVTRLEPASAILTMINRGVHWSFVEHATIYVFDPDYPKDEYLAFRTEFIPMNIGENLNILPFQVDLTSFFISSSIGLRAGLHFRGASPQTIESILRLKFNIIVE